MQRQECPLWLLRQLHDLVTFRRKGFSFISYTRRKVFSTAPLPKGEDPATTARRPAARRHSPQRQTRRPGTHRHHINKGQHARTLRVYMSCRSSAAPDSPRACASPWRPYGAQRPRSAAQLATATSAPPTSCRRIWPLAWPLPPTSRDDAREDRSGV